MNAFKTHFAFEFRTGIRNRQLLLLNYLFPIGFYFMMGLIMTDINPGFRDVLIPSMVTFSVLAATLLGLPEPIVKAREAGILRSFKIYGVSAMALLVIPVLTTMVHLTIVALVITLTAPLLFGAPLPTNWAAFILVFGVGTFTCSFIGILIGVIARSTRITILYSQILFLPSMLLGGLMVPHHVLSETMGKVALLLPASHVMNAFKGIAMGQPASFHAWGSLSVLLMGGVIAFVLALYGFKWDSSDKKI